MIVVVYVLGGAKLCVVKQKRRLQPGEEVSLNMTIITRTYVT